MAGIDNRTVYPLDESGGEVIVVNEQGQTRAYQISVGGSTTPSLLAHHYRANLNKTNETLASATVLNGGTLPSGVTIEYNNTDLTLIGYTSVVKISGWNKNYIYTPLFQGSCSSFDMATKIYRHQKGHNAPSMSDTIVYIVIEHSYEDFQFLENFPFEVFFYNEPES